MRQPRQGRQVEIAVVGRQIAEVGHTAVVEVAGLEEDILVLEVVAGPERNESVRVFLHV